ncbi:MAG: hypothetical protein LC732_09370 [Acidobacteria bacterium]|nr:hypothetical protein [Acidobacteriota bacterium]
MEAHPLEAVIVDTTRDFASGENAVFGENGALTNVERLSWSLSTSRSQTSQDVRLWSPREIAILRRSRLTATASRALSPRTIGSPSVRISLPLRSKRAIVELTGDCSR